jgi:hypothetical protein
MELSIIIPVMGQLNDTKAAMASVFHSCANLENHEIIIINNTKDPNEKMEIKMWIERFLPVKNKQKFIYHEQDNPGMIMTTQKGYELAHGDVLAFFHNDVIIYENGWDLTVLGKFEQDPSIGLAGFFGHQGVHFRAGRQDCWTSMLEAEYHGNRLNEEFKYVISVDGFSIICKKEMLDKRGGFDTETYQYHHLYDKDIGMESLARGYKNIVMNIPCHHISGVTANRPDWQNQANELMGGSDSMTGDQILMTRNMDAFDAKWGRYLPLFVDNEGNLTNELIRKHYEN